MLFKKLVAFYRSIVYVLHTTRSAHISSVSSFFDTATNVRARSLRPLIVVVARTQHSTAQRHAAATARPTHGCSKQSNSNSRNSSNIKPPPTNMRAVVLREQGPPGVLALDPCYPPPPPRKAGELLIRAAAASVNPVDAKTRAGAAVPRALVALPRVLGSDVAGVVEDADASSPFARGDRVFGCTGQHIFWSRYGTYAEKVVAPARCFARAPPNLTLQEAAAVPLAAMTAWQALAPRMPLRGRAVLVHAGAGGVGSFAVQIAKAQGAALVAATCGPSNVEFVRALGADVVVDYTRERFEDAAPGPYDVIVDTIGGEYEARGLPLLAPKAAAKQARHVGGGGSSSSGGDVAQRQQGQEQQQQPGQEQQQQQQEQQRQRQVRHDPRGGHYVNLLTHGWSARYGGIGGGVATLLSAARGTLKAALGLGPSYALTVIRPVAADGLEQVAELIAAGKVKINLDCVVPLERAAEAHARVDGGHTRGKVVLKIANL